MSEIKKLIFKTFWWTAFNKNVTVEINKDKNGVYSINYNSTILSPLSKQDSMILDFFLSDIDFNLWKEEYHNPNALDGEQWNIEIVFNDYRKAFEGTNAYPKDWGIFLNIIHWIKDRYNDNGIRPLTIQEKWILDGMPTITPSLPKLVNAHINNISFPKTIEELEWYIYEHGCYNVEDIVNESKDGWTEWTVPRNSAIGDIVLFFHAKTAIQWIRKLETTTRNLDEKKHDKIILTDWLKKARALYSLYGGKIFAIGRVASRPEMEDEQESVLHWSSRIYAKVGNLVLLEKPIDIAEFNSFIMVSRQSAITPLPSNEYQKLKDIVVANNTNLPEYYLKSEIGDYNLSKINAVNFLEITKQYRTRFLLETNFRSYYVDYFLQAIAGKKYYRECQCHTKENPLARVDNVFVYNGKKFLLEVKLNVLIEKNIKEQLNQYINAEYIYLTNNQKNKTNDFERDFMYVIDMFALYQYTPKTQELVSVLNLDDINTIENIQEKFKILYTEKGVN